ncbi:Hothead-like protein [Thalictrum thalictroides]|uniref:Hothead-like protein n=1 Tax=Thalictrum thalictroides TaxID=46969 RepID=A0A7J6VES7_THATH|nr:Hothead-like protein [Thalictrum thalictroides]
MDLDECVEMVHEMKKVAISMDLHLGTKYSQKIAKIIADQTKDKFMTESMSANEELRNFCKMYRTSYLHSNGGCNVGSVVDMNYKVYGVEGLRVVDASTLNDLMGTSPMGTLLMLGRYLGIQMLKEREMSIRNVQGKSPSSSSLTLTFPSSSSMSQGGHGALNIVSNFEQVQGKSFDYIVVGGGTSGCPLAATLSERFTVLLIERGGYPFQDPLIMEKKNFYHWLGQVNEFTSIAQKVVSEEGVENYRGRVLGGSTAINGGVYSRASKEYIEKAGWDVRLVKEAYEWVESKMVFEPKELTPLQSKAKDIFVDAGILPFNGYCLEHVQGTKLTGTLFDENERRHCAAHLLEAGDRNKLTVLLNATVKNILFSTGSGDKPRAHGIRFIKSYDNNVDDSYEVYLNQPTDSGSWGDIILSAGALGSPQILMLSGIGVPEHLGKFNITPLINALQVGQGISDNPCIMFILDVVDVPHSIAETSQVLGITKNCKFLIQFGGGRITNTTQSRSLLAKLSHPRSKGKLELNSTDPRKNPSLKFNYLLEKMDLDDCVEMVREMKNVAISIDSFLGTKYSEKIASIITDCLEQDKLVTGATSTEDELRHFCRIYRTSYLHSNGGCNVGSVIDRDYKVYGVEGLRVVDASSLNDLMGSSPMGTLLMLGRYQGIQMLKEREMV